MVFYARFVIFVLLTQFNIYDQLGARFDEVKKHCPVRGVETFNSTKKKMGICFKVSNRWKFRTVFYIFLLCLSPFEKKKLWLQIYHLSYGRFFNVNCECFINQFDLSASKSIHLFEKCLIVSSWCRHQTGRRTYIGKVQLRSCSTFVLIRLHLMAQRAHLKQRWYILPAHDTICRSVSFFEFWTIIHNSSH